MSDGARKQAGEEKAALAARSAAATGKPASATVASVPAAWADLPGWADDDHLAALKAFRLSCPRLLAAASGARPGKVKPTPELAIACEAALALPEKVTRAQARTFFETHFLPERLVHDAPHGLLTGYYEPLLEGSRTRDARFATPIHRRPPDLVTLIDETDRGAVGGQLTHARRTAAGLVPFATRAEITGGALASQGLELLWLADPVDVFFLQVQGSGRIRLTDGTIVRVHYDGKNGHPYTSVGRYLIDKGLFAADRMSLGALGRWLRADPSRGREAMNQNASYVFFRELADDAKGPLGALEVPLTAGRSLAVDPRYHALGAPVYVAAPTLVHAGKGAPFQRLMIAQDVGSAIKGPERGDIYFGSGDAAGRTAGVTKHPGHLFALKSRPPAAQVVTGSAVPPAKAPAKP